MSDNPPPDPNISDAFQNLGNNLVQLMRTAWDSPERKHLQSEIEVSLTDLSSSIQEEVTNFQASPTGQQLKSNLTDIHEQIKSSEFQSRMRDEILDALKVANRELERVINHWSEGAASDQASSASGTNTTQDKEETDVPRSG
jgi:ATP:corrinoid adenosyltransferase